MDILGKLQGLLQVGPDYVVPFLILLTILVFVHEMGHYAVARWNGVRVEVFSIGFGPELFGFNDSHGTRWKFSLIPLGGYVKMQGEAEDPEAATRNDTAFNHKTVGQRSAIVAAGPLANYAFALVVFAALFAMVGQRVTPPQVLGVHPGTAAERAGLQKGDTILQIDGQDIWRFEQIAQIVRLRPGEQLDFVIRRGDREIAQQITPDVWTDRDVFGMKSRIGRLGIEGGGTQIIKRGPLQALWYAARECLDVTAGSLTAIWQMIIRTRSPDELGGPLRIAKISGDVWKLEWASFISLMAFMSVSLGLINLFPIPMLDGGHLLFYVLETLRGRPLGARAQEYGLRIGLALVLGIMVFATWNDLQYFQVLTRWWSS